MAERKVPRNPTEGKCALQGHVISLHIAGKCHAGISPLAKVSLREVPPTAYLLGAEICLTEIRQVAKN